jgi:hypothetical protein
VSIWWRCAVVSSCWLDPISGCSSTSTRYCAASTAFASTADHRQHAIIETTRTRLPRYRPSRVHARLRRAPSVRVPGRLQNRLYGGKPFLDLFCRWQTLVQPTLAIAEDVVQGVPQ